MFNVIWNFVKCKMWTVIGMPFKDVVDCQKLEQANEYLYHLGQR